ncbi:uncharacterized protein LOC128253098 [Drosophila gunungcola]|uniref:Uncharacterized protein n=1 Tax=Drosophila gunungcola TaxID=103775 RepID=A0A9P9YK14_9MUSC|nr:uncharacterized protein LOC128253098 [Drosophila gunungcola]KAI8038173.1 hypothetical protein M5D96_008862 [Drosophila gunungcola]
MSMANTHLQTKNYRMESVGRTVKMHANIKMKMGYETTPPGTTEVPGNAEPPRQTVKSPGKRQCPPRKHPERKTRDERTIEKFRNIDFFGQRDSNNILTVQNLEFPDANIKRTELHLRNECGKSVVRGRGRDFASSSNSHFRDGVETVKIRKEACPSTTQKNQVDIGPSGERKSSWGKISEAEPDSEELVDSMHAPSTRPPNFQGEEWRRPCPASFVAGAPRPRIGRCPKNYEQLAKLTPARQKFFLTQDPRKSHCLVNPAALRHKPLTKEQEFSLISKLVKHGDNLCASTGSETSDTHICEVMDLQNPLKLDFHGMDYKTTYEQDEVEQQNTLTFWRVQRYMARRKAKKSTKEKVEAELKEERLAVPQRYNTKIKDVPEEEPSPPRSPRLVHLYRSPDKPGNKLKIEEERRRRAARYKDIYLRKKQREEAQLQERRRQEAAVKEVEARTVAEDDLRADVAVIDDAIERSFRKHVELQPIIRKRKVFPKTLTETERLKAIMHREDCARRDKARVTQQFFLERTGKLKHLPDAEQQLGCDQSIEGSVGSTPSEQSSDDEDYLQVGKIGDKFQLRGFHFKHGDGLRGKLHRHQIMQGQRTVKGCLTREEWLNQLVPHKEPIKLDVERGIIKVLDPDDPNLDLFPPEPLLVRRHERRSAVREFIDQRLGLHYHRRLRKNLKIVKPKPAYNVKKFNLIRYVFPEKVLVPDDRVPVEEMEVLDATKVNTTLEYLDLKQQLAKSKRHKKKLARMQLLGLPCIEKQQLRAADPCLEVEEELDVDWVPTPEPAYNEGEGQERQEGGGERTRTVQLFQNTRCSGNAHALSGQEGIRRGRLSAGEESQPARWRGNMPAPTERQKTLTIHPRRRRDYANERVPSAIFNEVLQNSALPLLEQPEPEKLRFANVRTKKRPYTEIFEARHHHDHWAPTQVKNVHVQYQPKTVLPEVTKVAKKVREPVLKFERANPPSSKYVDKDLTMPSYDFEKVIAEHLAATRTDNKEAAGEVVPDMCQPYDFVFHSRDPEELAKLDFPGRKQYLELLRETREAIYETKDIEPGEEHLLVDRRAVVADLEEDLRSIENCLSSLSSSDCTDLSNDSGSYLVIEDRTKLPLDYIRKPLVPFEEMRRARFHAAVIDVNAEDEDPYRMLPFSGQHKEQANMLGPKDTFFTFSTRLRNSLRLRLEVAVPDVRKTLLGPGNQKYFGAVITDLDENYIEELKSRATIKSFKFKTSIQLLKDAMRLKYESLLIQGQMVRTKIYDRMNERHWVDMKNTKNLYEALFAKWKKKEYNAAMTMVYQVKSYYETTDKLKQEYRNLERELMMLNMDIVFIEGHWIRCIMLQNFHYLMGDQDWRAEHDWIHLVPKGGSRGSAEGEADEEPSVQATEIGDEEGMELEPYDVSIAKRAVVNIRVRDKDDAWAIRTFYYDVYMQRVHPILQVFPDAESFLQGLESLKTKTFMLLLEMHLTLSIHTELQGRLETFVDWCTKDLKEKQEYVARKSAKKFFMEDRAMEMEQRVHQYLGRPIEETIADEDFNKHRAVLAEVWRRVVPDSVRGTSDVLPSTADMVAAISDVVMEILSKFEHMDIEKVRSVEATLRKRRRYREKLSHQAFQVERRIDMEMKKVRRNLEPPYKKPKREGRLPRLFLKKRVVPEEKEVLVISENTKNFVRAFREDGYTGDQITHTSLLTVDNMQEQIVPFYFDHFLKINGYTPNYNFRTNVDLRDGPEFNRLKVREVLPDVLARLETLEMMHKKTMEENIQRNPKMYENVI